MGYINVYTRQECELYPRSLADSVHLSYSNDGINDLPLNQNYGILFARAAIRQNNTIEERGIINPVVFCMDEIYGIAAQCVNAEGDIVEPDKILLWTTADFISFKEHNLVECSGYEDYLASGSDKIEVPDESGELICKAWLPIHAVDVAFQKKIELRHLEDLDSITADVLYSDGTIDKKRVSWNLDKAVLVGRNKYAVTGEILKNEYKFPMAVGYADPVIFKWDNSWYFLATNDNRKSIGLYVRKADSVDALFLKETQEYCILDYDEEHDFVQTFWAPEFHVIGKDLYILFAVGGRKQGPQAHMMRLKSGGSIINPADWDLPVRVCRRDGSWLTDEGITIDMTYFKVKEQSYLLWNCRKGFGTPLDTGGILFIAAVDDNKPWILASDPVELSRSVYGWENNSGTLNNEGPYPLLLHDSLYISYSGGAATGYTYAVGFLRISMEEDLLDPSKWEKISTAVLSSSSIDGIQGPGHNSFFIDDDGKIMVVYHAQEREKYFTRCTMMHRVHINKYNFPVLNMSAERDLPEELRLITIEVTIK